MRALLLLFVPSIAAADPCEAVRDPIVTPVRDAYLDAQRSACVRDEAFVALAPHALIDTPGFHGVLGGDLSLGGRLVVHRIEIGVQVRAVDFAFVQNAVNKVTHTGFGPVVIGAAANQGTAAIAARLELPYTQSFATLRTSAALEGLYSADLAPAVTLHGRLTALGMLASSEAGETHRLAFRAGADLVWLPRPSLALQAGADLMAGWAHGFDDVLARAGVHWAMTGLWRLRSGVGLPIGGSERTNAIVDVAVIHDL
jgi:hypothetical protein